MNETEGIPVIVRIRPILPNDIIKEKILETTGESITLKNLKTNQQGKPFIFDHVYDEDSQTKEIYDNHCFNILDNIMHGYNGTIMSYGMTGSGKTHTMSHDPDGGIVQNVFKDLFDLIKISENNNFIIRLSYFQIYLDKIIDLLGDKKKQSLQIRGVGTNIYIEGLTSQKCESPEDCKRLFEKGRKARVTAETQSNFTSSRSHAILQIIVKSSEGDQEGSVIHEGNLFLVDLAGSERLEKSKAEGLRKDEAAKINLSMLALGSVITALATKAKFVPYNNSKLTKVLKNALGGNSKTVFIANISPSAGYYNETSDALRYAQNVKLIKNTPKVNEDFGDSKIKELQSENDKLKKIIEDLKAENEKYKNMKNNKKSGDESSDYDSENEEHKKLSEQERHRRRIKTKLKYKLQELAQNDESMEEILQLISATKVSKEIDLDLKEDIEFKRMRAKQEQLNLFINETEYNKDELDLLYFNYKDLEAVDKDIVSKIQRLLKTIHTLRDDNEKLMKAGESLNEIIEGYKKREQNLIYDTASNDNIGDNERNENNDEIAKNLELEHTQKSEENALIDSNETTENMQDLLKTLRAENEKLKKENYNLKNKSKDYTDKSKIKKIRSNEMDQKIKNIHGNTNKSDLLKSDQKLKLKPLKSIGTVEKIKYKTSRNESKEMSTVHTEDKKDTNENDFVNIANKRQLPVAYSNIQKENNLDNDEENDTGHINTSMSKQKPEDVVRKFGTDESDANDEFDDQEQINYSYNETDSDNYVGDKFRLNNASHSSYAKKSKVNDYKARRITNRTCSTEIDDTSDSNSENEENYIENLKQENMNIKKEIDDLRLENDNFKKKLQITENKESEHKESNKIEHTYPGFIEILNGENDYTKEDLSLLTLDINSSNYENNDLIRNMKKLLEKQVCIIDFYKIQVKQILMISEEDEEYFRKYFTGINSKSLKSQNTNANAEAKMNNAQICNIL